MQGAVPWIVSCGAGAAAWVAFGSELATRVVHLDAEGALRAGESALVAPARPVDESRPLSTDCG